MTEQKELREYVCLKGYLWMYDDATGEVWVCGL